MQNSVQAEEANGPETRGDRVPASKGSVSLEAGLLLRHGNNFNVVRLVAAFAVIFSHAARIAGSPDMLEPLRAQLGGGATLGSLAVSVFFMISGLLVGRSAIETQSVRAYLAKRALRILPALWALMLVTVFVIGLAFTSRPIRDYLQSVQVYRYLQGAVFRFGTELPGLFENNRYPRSINNSLWSVRVEVVYYLLLPLLVVWFRSQVRVGLVAVSLFASLVVASSGGVDFGGRLSLLSQVIGVSHYFLAGILAFECRRRIMLSIPWALVGLLTWAVLSRSDLTYHAATVLCLGYALLVFCLHPALSLGDPLRGVDVSYGVYLYGFPVQQCVETLSGLSWISNAVVASIIVVPVSLVSWFLVEEPALRLKWMVSRVRAPG